MKKLSSLIFLLAFTQQLATAQPFNVSVTGGSPSGNYCTAVSQSNHSVHISYDANSSFILTRTDASGHAVRSVRVSSDSLVQATAITSTADDGVIVTGHYQGPMPQPTTFTLSTTRPLVVFAAKFDNMFNLLWSKLYYQADPMANTGVNPAAAFYYTPVDISKSVNIRTGREQYLVVSWLIDGSVIGGQNRTNTIVIEGDGSSFIGSIMRPSTNVSWRPRNISYSPFFNKHIIGGMYFDGNDQNTLFSVDNNLSLINAPNGYKGSLYEPGHAVDAPDVATSKNLVIPSMSSYIFNVNNPNPCSALSPGSSLVMMKVAGTNFNTLRNVRAYIPNCEYHLSNVGIAMADRSNFAIGMSDQSAFSATTTVWQTSLMIIDPFSLNMLSFRRFNQDASFFANIINDRNGQILLTSQSPNGLNNTPATNTRLIKTTSVGASYCNVSEKVFQDSIPITVTNPPYTYQVSQQIETPNFNLSLQNIPVNSTPCASSYNRMLSAEDESAVAQELSIYPNPLKAGDALHIKGGDLQSVEVYSISGQRIDMRTLSGGSGECVFSDGLSVPGLYIVKLVSKSNKTSYQKISVIK